MDQVKSWLASKTVWAGIVTFLAAVGAVFNIDFGAVDQAAVIDALYSIVSAVGALLAIWARITATAKIGKS